MNLSFEKEMIRTKWAKLKKKRKENQQGDNIIEKLPSKPYITSFSSEFLPAQSMVNSPVALA